MFIAAISAIPDGRPTIKQSPQAIKWFSIVLVVITLTTHLNKSNNYFKLIHCGIINTIYPIKMSRMRYIYDNGWHFTLIPCIDRISTQIAKFMGPTWGPPGSYWPQMGPILVPWTLLSGEISGLQQQRLMTLPVVQQASSSIETKATHH